MVEVPNFEIFSNEQSKYRCNKENDRTDDIDLTIFKTIVLAKAFRRKWLL